MDGAELLHDVAVVMGKAVVDGIVDGMVLEVVVAAGVGIVEVIPLLALLGGLFFPYLG